ncbi:MAG TPA: penicillin acylase family protein [Pyrinomonadaceae bacterium]|nr:penicillin acylase family protein [Pyrinomonadaceae bacterium]
MRRLIIVVGCLCLFTSGLLGQTAGPSPQTGAPEFIQIQGLKGRVAIRRDERGIPYVEATNDEDLYFGQGYATASDRLWQMDLFRRTARGELAEVLGAGPNNIALDQDKLHRTYGFSQAADEEYANLSPKSRALLEAYARGVNAYASSLDAKSRPPEFQILNYEFRPWIPQDSLVAVKLFFEALSDTWRIDLMRQGLASLPPEKQAALMPVTSSIDVLVVGKDIPVRATPTRTTGAITTPLSSESQKALAHNASIAADALARVGLYADELAASNNWVISGKRTVSGKPLLANDPHLRPTAPSIWYMVHLSAPGVRVAGVTSPGLPGVVIGHNEHVAWGFTNVGPDVQDLYVEKFDPANPKRYQTPSGWQEATIRREEIKVRKGLASPEHDVVTQEVTVTRHGPIIFEGDGKRYALRWTAFDSKRLAGDLSYGMNRARNWNEFNVGLQSFTAPTQNIIYADVDGHIGYHASGIVPIRKSGDGSLPYDGSTDAGEWTDYIPFAKLPNVYDPPSGMIVTANQRIVGTDYPYHLSNVWAQPYRARRIFDLLSEKPKHNADDFRRILGDVYSIAGSTFARETVRTLRPTLTPPADDKLRATLDAFEKWDGRVNAESTVAPMMAQMRLAFRSKILTAALGPDLVKSFQWSNFDTALDRIIKDQPANWLPKEFPTYAALLRASFDEARQTLTRNMGADESKWTWGEMVKARFPHPLSGAPLIGVQFTVPPFPQNGTGGFIGATVNVGAAVSMRLIADPGDWDKTQMGIALGESGLNKSPYWSDQLADWRAVTPREFPFTAGAVQNAAKSTLVLAPKNE